MYIIVGDSSSRGKWLIVSPPLLALMVTLQYFNLPQWLIFMLYFLVNYIIFFNIYRNNMYRSQFIMLAYVLVQMATHIIVQNLASLMMKRPVEEILNQTTSRILISIIALSLCMLLTWIFKYFVTTKELRLIHTSKTNTQFINKVAFSLNGLLLTVFMFIFYISIYSIFAQILAIKVACFSLLFFISSVRYASDLIENEMFKEKSGKIQEALLSIETKERRLKNLAFYDETTKCYNREYALKTLQNLFQTEEPFSLCFVDLDGLKYVNDTYGHQAGDKYIQTVAYVLKNEIKGGYLCRYGGDEFLVILPSYDSFEAEQIMLKAFLQLNEPAVVSLYPYTLSFSYGVIEKNDKQLFRYKNELEMIQLADERMYQQKMEQKKART